MTREKAINVLEDALSRAVFMEDIDVLEMAIAALREHEELARNSHGIETACEYCNGSGKRFLVDDDIPFGSYNNIRIAGDKAFLDDADGFSIRIKFCPMCGRRLEEV